jgi:hypothetical protein
LWDMRYPDAETVPGDSAGAGGATGPLAKPGTYHAHLQLGDETWTTTFEIIKDPRLTTAQDAFEAQFDLLMAIRDKLSEIHRGVKRLRSIRAQVESWGKRAAESQKDSVHETANSLKARLDEIENALILPPGLYGELSMNEKTRLNGKLANLVSVVASADRLPTKQSGEMFAELAAEIDAQLGKLSGLIAQDIPAFNEQIRQSDLPAILTSDSLFGLYQK